MRTKEEILKAEAEEIELCKTEDQRRTLQYQLIIETLIDIRDTLVELHETQRYFLNIISGKD